MLRLDGRDVTQSARHALLAEIVAVSPPLFMRSRPFADGLALLAEAERLGLKGIVANRSDAPYRPGNAFGNGSEGQDVARLRRSNCGVGDVLAVGGRVPFRRRSVVQELLIGAPPLVISAPS